MTVSLCSEELANVGQRTREYLKHDDQGNPAFCVEQDCARISGN